LKARYLFLTLVAVFTFSNVTLCAKTFTYGQVHRMPKSTEKDYYIWRFLSQKSTTAKEAKEIILEVSIINKKLLTAYNKKTGLKPLLPQTKATQKQEERWSRRSKANKYFQEGLKLLEKREPKLAVSYFTTAYKNYVKRYEKDKVLFWLYLSTKNTEYIKALLKSHQPNIYTLIASDTVKKKYPKTITPFISKSHISGFDITNPIDWAKIKYKMKHSSNIDALAEEYKSQETIGIYTYLKAKASNYTKIYFPMPYQESLSYLSPQRQALIYAIARQESRFVPASVSRSFALGMMQFMPFLIEHIAKKKGEKIDLDEIFNPEKALEYANFHLDYLTKYLYHPLFIAYAYNGGIGFTKRYITNPRNFRRGPYEPYMSMEKMENYQAREYGKKVLANYVIYLNKLGIPTRIFSLLKILATPSLTDSFRS